MAREILGSVDLGLPMQELDKIFNAAPRRESQKDLAASPAHVTSPGQFKADAANAQDDTPSKINSATNPKEYVSIC